MGIITVVKAYHNIGDDPGRRFLRGYAPGDPLVHVFTTHYPGPRHQAYPAGGAQAICDQVYQLLNIGDDPHFGEPDARAVEYRQRRNRSLSVGDVVQVDSEYWACMSFGWQRLTEPPAVVRYGAHGSTPLASANGAAPCV